MSESPLNILQTHWGHTSFRSPQEQIIQSILDGNDTLALLPTGGGKSICYQIPALCKDGICLVISPLIALMKDQVYHLQKQNIPASAIYSGIHYKEIDRIFDNCIYGNIKLLYLSPERLTTELARTRIQKMNVSLLAVDEAHCVSQWGYDFRPPYLQIAEIREFLPQTPILALTATATKKVISDIQEKLEFKNGAVFKKSFARENLAYVVLKDENKLKKLLDIFTNVQGSGIVYVKNRRLAKELALFLKRNRISADFYHAGLNSELRSAKQDAWMQNKTRILVSTNAFGMGIDKSDVRAVVHFDLPESLEAYFQEAGRAGRDEKKSYAILLYGPEDKASLLKKYKSSFPGMKEIRKTYQALGSYFQLATGGGEGISYDFDIIEFCKNFKLAFYPTFSCLKILEKAGWIVLTDSVFIPSRLKIQVTREDLYDFQLKNPKLDLIIKTILRLTHGAFNNYVNFRERQVAKFLKISVGELTKALVHLKKEGILDYCPQKDKPQIIFIKDRVPADNLTIDRKMYKFRKDRYAERLQKAIAYAENPICRSQQLLRYFDEKNAKACGICDLCLKRAKEGLSAENYERFKKKIHLILKREKLTEEQVLDSFSPRRKKQVTLAIEFLLDEGWLEKKEDHLYWVE